MLRNRNREDYDYYNNQGYNSYYPPQGGYNANYQNYNNNWYDQEQQDGYWRFVPDDEPQERSINIKRVILLLLALVLVIGGIGGGVYFFLHRDQSAVMVCESQTDYNKGIGLTFYLGEDGKTIEQIDKVDTVSLDFISNNLNTENTEEIFAEYKKSMEEQFNQTVEKYKSYGWFSANLDNQDDYIRTTYSFDVSSKDFKYGDVEEMMKEFTLDYYYNTDEKAFIYDEAKFLDTSTPLGSIENVQCTKTDITTVKKEKKSDEKSEEKASSGENTEEKSE